jgi:hypothetical protein
MVSHALESSCSKLNLFCHTKSTFLKNKNFQRKNDTQQEHGGEEILPHLKIKQQEFKSTVSCPNLN